MFIGSVAVCLIESCLALGFIGVVSILLRRITDDGIALGFKKYVQGKRTDNQAVSGGTGKTI